MFNELSNARRMSSIISPAFAEPERGLRTGEYNQIVVKGGRGSTKSSWASTVAPRMMLKHPEINCIVLRKVANTLRSSVYAQYVWAIAELGLSDYFKRSVSPMEIVYKKTGQKIMFFGADDPGKLKSLKMATGYGGMLHFEELDQFAGEEEIRNIEQSVLRGGPLAFEIKSFNPPRTKDNWANQYCLEEKPGQLIHHSTYLTTPKEWLGERFLADANFLKQVNERAYRHEYLGEPIGSGGEIFDNVQKRTITAEERATFDRFYFGLDHGFAVDPAALVKCYYNKNMHTLYLLDEFVKVGASFDTIAQEVRRLNPNGAYITADSAEPRSNNEISQRGINVTPAIKGPGSVEHGTRWLQDLSAIVIDPATCPEAAKEFASYEYEQDRQGRFKSCYPDKNNHTIDAVRYALEPIIGRKEIKIIGAKPYGW